VQRANCRNQSLGCVAFADERINASPQGFDALLGTAAERDEPQLRPGHAKSIQKAVGAQAGQLPIEQHQAGSCASDQVRQVRRRGALADDEQIWLLFKQKAQGRPYVDVVVRQQDSHSRRADDTAACAI